MMHVKLGTRCTEHASEAMKSRQITNSKFMQETTHKSYNYSTIDVIKSTNITAQNTHNT